MQNFRQEYDTTQVRSLIDKIKTLETQNKDLQNSRPDPDLENRCHFAEESLRRETENSEKMRAEIQILKNGVRDGLRKIGISFPNN